MAMVLLKYVLLLCEREINGYMKCLNGGNAQFLCIQYKPFILTNSYAIENLY